MSRTFRIVVGLVLAAASTTVALAAPAQAAETKTGRLEFSPTSGLDSTRITLSSPQSCPADTTHGYAVVYGPGFPKAGQTVVQNSLNTFSDYAPFAVKMQDTMLGFAAINGATLKGNYTVSFYCVDDTNTIGYAVYSGVIAFDGQHKWRANATAVPSPGATPYVAAPPTVAPSAASSRPAASASAGASSTDAASPTPSEQVGVSQLPAANGVGQNPNIVAGQAKPASSSDQGSLLKIAVAVAAVGLIAFGILYYLLGRRDEELAPSGAHANLKDKAGAGHGR
jgi:hypothetical protein